MCLFFYTKIILLRYYSMIVLESNLVTQRIYIIPRYYEQNKSLRDEKFSGRKGHRIQLSVILCSVTADYYRLQNYMLGILKLDLYNCYHRLLHTLCELCMDILDLSRGAIQFQTIILTSSMFYTTMCFGVSTIGNALFYLNLRKRRAICEIAHYVFYDIE